MRTFVICACLCMVCWASAQTVNTDGARSYYVKGKESAGQVHEVIPKAKRGYYVKDGRLVDGVFIEDANRLDRMTRAIIPKQQGHEATVLYPRDIDEYGFPGEERYVSCTILRDSAFHKVFLEEFVHINDSTSLLYYREESNEEFYLQTGEDIRLLTEDNFRMLWEDMLAHNEGCLSDELRQELSARIDYHNIRKFILAYQHCNENLIQRVRYGVTASVGGGSPMSNAQAVPPTHYSGIGLSWTAGAFVQVPLDRYFNFRPEVQFAYLNHNHSTQPTSKYTRYSLQVPLLFRYNVNQVRGRFVPYVEAGPLLDFRLGGRLETHVSTNSGVSVEAYDNTFFQAGLAAGAGVEYKLSRKYSLYAGLRYHFLRGENMQRDREAETTNHLLFTLGWGF